MPRESGGLWHNRSFALLWLAQAISQTAQNAFNYGLIVLVQTRTGSSAQLSLAVLSVVVPSVIFGLVAGAYVDRRDKRRVLVGSNALRAASMLGFIVFGDALMVVYLTTFVFSSIGQFFAPAELAMIPALVARRRLIEANSLFQVTFTGSQLVGFVLIGPLTVSLIGLQGLFAAVALAFVACAALSWPLPTTFRRADPRVEGFAALWHEVSDVLAIVRADRALTSAMIYWTLGATLALVLATLAPAFAVSVLGVRAEDSVFVLAPAGLGMALGAAALSRWGQGRDVRRLIGVGLLVLGIALSSMGVVGSGSTELLRAIGEPASEANGASAGLIGTAMATALMAGLAFVAVVTPALTLIQERAPAEARGRVVSIQFALANVASILPLVFLGGLADVIGVGRTLLLVGLAVLLIGLISLAVGHADRLVDAGQGEPPVAG